MKKIVENGVELPTYSVLRRLDYVLVSVKLFGDSRIVSPSQHFVEVDCQGLMMTLEDGFEFFLIFLDEQGGHA